MNLAEFAWADICGCVTTSVYRNNTAEAVRSPLLNTSDVQPHTDAMMLWFSITLKWLSMHTNQHEAEQLYGPTGLAGSLPARHSLRQFTASALMTRIWETQWQLWKICHYVRCISSMSSYSSVSTRVLWGYSSGWEYNKHYCCYEKCCETEFCWIFCELLVCIQVKARHKTTERGINV